MLDKNLCGWEGGDLFTTGNFLCYHFGILIPLGWSRMFCYRLGGVEFFCYHLGGVEFLASQVL